MVMIALREVPLITRSPGHFVILDWFRFLSALLVVLCHARIDHWLPYAQLAPESRTLLVRLFFLAIRPGPEAVVVFFVLSGFLVGGKIIERLATSTFSPSDYFIDRFSRIYTPLISALFLSAFCLFVFGGGLPDGYFQQLLCNLFQFQGILCQRLDGNEPLWSLSYEVWFYVLAGSLSTLFVTRGVHGRDRLICLLAFAMALASAWCLTMLRSVYLFCWILGALAYVWPVRRRSRLVILFCALIFLAGVVICQATGSGQGGLIVNSDSVHAFGTLLVASSFSFLLPHCIYYGQSFKPSVACGLGAGLAAFSYTLYLTHFPLLLVLRLVHLPFESFSGASLLFYASKILVCVLVAWLFYLPFERNTSRVRLFIRRAFDSFSPATLS